MPLSSLKKYNEENEIPLKNARNAAAGAIRNLDTSQTKKRNLKAASRGWMKSYSYAYRYICLIFIQKSAHRFLYEFTDTDM